MIGQDVERLLDQCKAVKPNPCAGCQAFNHAEKCAKVRDTDCRAINGKENVCKNY